MSQADHDPHSAALLFERPVPEGYAAEWQERLRTAREDKQAAATSALVFRIEEEWLALPNSTIREVVADVTPHRLPHRDDTHVLGLVNIRGELCVALSLRAVLGIPTASAHHPDAHHTDSAIRRLPRPRRQIVVKAEGGPLVIPVDEVAGIAFVEDAALEPVPDTLRKSLSNFVRALFKHHEQTVGLLDDEPLFAALNHQLG